MVLVTDDLTIAQINHRVAKSVVLANDLAMNASHRTYHTYLQRMAGCEYSEGSMDR